GSSTRFPPPSTRSRRRNRAPPLPGAEIYYGGHDYQRVRSRRSSHPLIRTTSNLLVSPFVFDKAIDSGAGKCIGRGGPWQTAAVRQPARDRRSRTPREFVHLVGNKRTPVSY